MKLLQNIHNPSAQLVLKGIIVSIPVVVFAVFAYRYFAVSGEWTVSYNFANPDHAIVEPFAPGGRAKDPEKNMVTGRTYQRIVGDPVYMNVTVPRSFEKVDVTVNYSNPDKQFAQFGVILSEDPYAVRLAPFEIPVIDQAQTDWHVLRGEGEYAGVTVLQREEQFATAADFFAQLPLDSAIGTYQYALTPEYTEDNYSALRGNAFVMSHALRGSHTFATYIEHETLNLTFTLHSDEGIAMAKTDLVITDVYGNRIYDQSTTGVEPDEEGAYTLEAHISDLATGVYYAHIQSADTVRIDQIETMQRKFVLKDTVVLDDENQLQAPLALYSSTEDVRMVTSTLDGLQQVRIMSGSEETMVDIDEVHAPYTWLDESVSNSIRSFSIEEDNLRLWTRGYFAFSEDAFFDPDYGIRRITEFTQIEDLDFIVYQAYTSPQHKRLESTQTVELPFEGMVGDRKELQFVLSLPGIDQTDAELTIHDVTLHFTRPGLFERIWNKVQN